eukprot:TRINITY_DN19904_c0_g1_i1.p1 TRINITY_DN19904_c0_g1~~TRINITY_DN19904_c0_g1_i1.p1  ORF type:complete len:213 (+),score=50.92 TRINITY_DN19904_c0_g1_i1:54-641(+)
MSGIAQTLDEWEGEVDGNMDAFDSKVPLQRCWTFWYFKPRAGADAADALLKVMDVDTIQDFWACFNALPSTATLMPKFALHMMKQGVKPEAEDEALRNGGVWSFKVDKSQGDFVWQALLMSTIGEQFACVLPRSDGVCGITVRGGPPQPNQVIFQVWHRDESSKSILYDKLKTILGKNSDLGSSTYRSNKDESRR